MPRTSYNRGWIRADQHNQQQLAVFARVHTSRRCRGGLRGLQRGLDLPRPLGLLLRDPLGAVRLRANRAVRAPAAGPLPARGERLPLPAGVGRIVRGRVRVVPGGERLRSHLPRGQHRLRQGSAAGSPCLRVPQLPNPRPYPRGLRVPPCQRGHSHRLGVRRGLHWHGHRGVHYQRHLLPAPVAVWLRGAGSLRRTCGRVWNGLLGL